MRGHEFHYSSLVPGGNLTYVVSLTDAQGGDRGRDGLKYANVVALYSHLHFTSQQEIPRSLVQTGREYSMSKIKEKGVSM